MSKKLTLQDLIEGQQKVLKVYQGLQKDCPIELVGILQKVVNVQGRVLHELGYRKPTDTKKKAPPKGMFKREVDKPVLPIKKGKKMSNDSEKPKKGTFKAKSVTETLGNDPVVDNEAPPEGMFDKPEVIVKEEKANPKRLNPSQMAAIKAAAAKGLNIKQISDKLMIVEAKVSKALGTTGKKSGGNLLGTNSQSSNETFQDEIKASKE